MSTGLLQNVLDLAKIGHIFVVTADDAGQPHMAAARELAWAEGHRVTLIEWFCPSTISNLHKNPKLSIVVWHSGSNTGYQVLGHVVNMLEVGVMDGHAEGEPQSLPQVERMLLIEVDRVLEFTEAPHSDIDIE